MIGPRLQRHLPAGLLTLLFLSLTTWSWRKWPDPLVDFGRELYVPWQLTGRKVLYRDVASIFGPLSPYLNALWFRLFGVSISTIFAVNLGILALTAAGIHVYVSRSADRIAAHLSTAAFLVLCGFSQYLAVGNYNFVAPYSHEATHGFALSIGGLLSVECALSRGSRSTAAVGGLCLGLVFLTKPEIFMALLVAVTAGFVVAGIMNRDRELRAKSPLASLAAYVVASAILPPLLFLGYFRTQAPLAAAVGYVTTAWSVLRSASPLDDPFYRSLLGLDHPAANILRMFRMTVGFAMCGAVAGLLDVATSSYSPSIYFRRIVTGLVRLGVPVAAYWLVSWDDVPIVFLPLTCAVLLLSLLAVTMRYRSKVLAPSPAITMAAAFSVVMLAKIALNTQIGHYGFFLASPALVLLIAVLVSGVPRALGRLHPGAGRLFREAAVLTLAAGLVAQLVEADRLYRMKTLAIGSGRDQFLASDNRVGPQGPFIAETLAHLEASGESGATMAVLPEGAMLNFLTRRPNPARYVTLMPPEMKIFGERAILSAFESSPPDVIVLAHKDAREYGFRPFGLEPRYGASIMAWVRSHYRTVDVIGDSPLTDDGAGFEILKRLPPTPSNQRIGVSR